MNRTFLIALATLASVLASAKTYVYDGFQGGGAGKLDVSFSGSGTYIDSVGFPGSFAAERYLTLQTTTPKEEGITSLSIQNGVLTTSAPAAGLTKLALDYTSYGPVIGNGVTFDITVNSLGKGSGVTLTPASNYGANPPIAINHSGTYFVPYEKIDGNDQSLYKFGFDLNDGASISVRNFNYANVTPEPFTAPLLIAGIGALVARRKKLSGGSR
jgi:hypothetical protein